MGCYRLDDIPVPTTEPPGPCDHYRKVPDNCRSHPDGRITCALCEHTWNGSEWQVYHLHRLREQLARDNPGETFVVDAGTVWLRRGGKDYGVYAATVVGVLINVMDFATGTTHLHRITPK